VAGLINRIKNIVEFSPDLHWSNADIISILSKRCKIPIIFDNVTRVMAWGELWYGIGERIKNFIVINLGYGIGAGIIVDGKPLYGPKGMAGEFGQITLDNKSKIQCDCGNYGCLEALASGHAIAEQAKRELKNGAQSLLNELCGRNYNAVTAEMVSRAANKGDALASRIFNQAAEYIGIGIAGLINLFTPKAVVLGGGVAQAGDLLFDKIKEVVGQRAIKTISKDVIITPATYGTNAAAMGAVALILNELLHLNQEVFDLETATTTTVDVLV
jgi:predicted NBD/HSP70 family sugar kinase